MKIKNIIISQYKPLNSSYDNLIKNYNVKIYFRPFFKVKGESLSNFLNQKIDLNNFTAIIFTSKNSIDNFFRISKKIKFKVSKEMKYICKSEAIALYLQKYIVYRKRKIFFGKKNLKDLILLIKKNKNEKFLFPCSNINYNLIKKDILIKLKKMNIFYKKIFLYKIVYLNIMDIKNIDYDILVFFSPSDIKSLFKNFPNFKQKKNIIATFGKVTFKEAIKSGLKISIKAPTNNTPSMSMALEKYIIKYNKKNNKKNNKKK